MSGRTLLLVESVVCSGLMAGLFFGWLVSVIPGLRRVEDDSYLETMQHINRAIVNPAFVIPFVLTPVLLGLAAVVEYRAGNDRRALFLATAGAVYVIGVLGVTAGGNIPLNNTLDAVTLPPPDEDSANRLRHSYETPWNRWHSLRTIGSALAFALGTVSMTMQNGEGS